MIGKKGSFPRKRESMAFYRFWTLASARVTEGVAGMIGKKGSFPRKRESMASYETLDPRFREGDGGGEDDRRGVIPAEAGIYINFVSLRKTSQSEIISI